MAKLYGLGKAERLKSRKEIEALFSSGKHHSFFPLKISYHFVPCNKEALIKIGVTASRKNFKRAVDRNRIKRLIKESYRLRKLPLWDEMKKINGLCLKIFFLYVGKELPSQTLVDEKTALIIMFLQNEIKQRS